MQRPAFEIPYYHDYISPALAGSLLEKAQPVPGVPGLAQVGKGGGLETAESLAFLARLYAAVKTELGEVLARRIQDRKFIDERVAACHAFNREYGRDWLDADYRTVLGLEDANGRVVIGPKLAHYCKSGGKPIAALPDFLKGPHVTLFGPPDSAKLAINAMNAYHRKLPNEPAVVEELLAGQGASPMWGADDEDSKTPLREDLIDAAVNLTGCFAGTLSLKEGGKEYALAKDHLSLPIKRFPGLALPSTFLFAEGNPIPLHLYDFALHLFRNWNDPRALVFYVPKLENEEEAAYIHSMIAAAERMIGEIHPAYKPGTVRLLIVLENPRAILRAHEIMDALYPYFAGASLGWHDYLASTARIFKNDSNYRIPVKADPDIVIKYIKASHLLLAEAVGSRGGIKIGGMYGILPLAGSERSLQLTLQGFIKDVVTQLKRDLTGFWVAHPDFVRLGLAFVEAWKRKTSGDASPLRRLVEGLLEPELARETMRFVDGPDIEGLDADHPNYVRALIVADIKESDFIANNHPDEIRYNVFQSLQYLTDWLSGNGCVALPTSIAGVPVRVMDDLATAERSRWEVWHEIHHGRFRLEDFLRIAHEEMNFIRRDLSDAKKIVQVKWDERTAKWYPTALKLMLKLMTDERPAEFATELLMPFTVDSVRASADPWAAIQALDPEKYKLDPFVARFDHFFEACGSRRFAAAMAEQVADDLAAAEKIVLDFSRDEVIEAAAFHGDIGQSKKSLDAQAAKEQAQVFSAGDSVQAELRAAGEAYRAKFGFKFLISAQGKSGSEILAELGRRLPRSEREELDEARHALWEITRKRLLQSGKPGLAEKLETLRVKHGIRGAAVALNWRGKTQPLTFGGAQKRFQLASLSKTLAAAFALEYFREKNIPLTAPINQLFAAAGSAFRLHSAGDPAWAESVTLEHLLGHTALDMHYVRGIPVDAKMPKAGELLAGAAGYTAVKVQAEPGKSFHYSGGGFLVLEHLIETRENKPIQLVAAPYLERWGMPQTTFQQEADCESGFFDDGKTVPGGRLKFPAFAAGALGTAVDVARFLNLLTEAHASWRGAAGLAHETAVEMLHGFDRGCRAFMGCDMGLGVFVIEAGANRFALHQGANEGFRALYLHCFAGPDRGKGLVILCNADNRGVAFIAAAAQEILRTLGVEGVDFSAFGENFAYGDLPQEQIVNMGYKALLLSAFAEDLPEEITDKGRLAPMHTANLLVGAKLLSVSNQKFARAENLISPHEPVFDPELFGRQGKIMDSWESARHNPLPGEAMILELKKTDTLRFVELSTKFHDGNHPESVRLSARKSAADEWQEILPRTAMSGHSLYQADLGRNLGPFRQVKVEMFPDGGLTRAALYAKLPEGMHFAALAAAKPVRFADPIPKTRKPLTIPYAPHPQEAAGNRSRALPPLNEASLAVGATLVRASNEHYGPAVQVISPFPAIHMFDGLESARSRQPGHHEEVIIRLGKPTQVGAVLLDFTFFVNNNPLYISIEALSGGKWVELVARTKVKAYAGNQRLFRCECTGLSEELKLITYPDGGVNRIKVFCSGAL